mmetsp:Transcript_22328/g.42093  ORF Transcript_22328/g.42093 Transcript_22328/m.42093 type:complete len:109 (-) Transcript_22328:94-420(-)
MDSLRAQEETAKQPSQTSKQPSLGRPLPEIPARMLPHLLKEGDVEAAKKRALALKALGLEVASFKPEKLAAACGQTPLKENKPAEQPPADSPSDGSSGKETGTGLQGS